MKTFLSNRYPLSALVLAAFVAVGCGGGGGQEAPDAEVADDDAPAAQQPQATGPTGDASVSGTVSFAGDVPEMPLLDMNADPECAAKHDGEVRANMLVLGDDNGMGNIFVKVNNPPEGNYAAPSDPVVVDQDGCLYKPRVAAVMAGQPLQYKNSDGILHNVHLLPEQNREQNIAMPATLTEKDVTLNNPEPMFDVKCDVHPWMQSYVAVMAHPFWAVTDDNGNFEIDDLPAGTYEVEAWHERLGTQTASITVADGESATADFSFGG